jgi:RNA polymerase primary sigma factor
MAFPQNISPGKVILAALMEKASLHGYLTMGDIQEAYQGQEPSSHAHNHLLSYLRRQGVDIVEEHQEPVDATIDVESESQSENGYVPDLYASQDTVEIYLKEMARVPLLSLQEEVSLAQRIERGRDALYRINNLSMRGKSRLQHQMEMMAEDGQNAREHIIKANTRLVVSIAKKYVGRGVPFLDLIQEGNLGLMKAVEKFDYKRGFRFSTYATWWIRQTITRAIADQGRTIRLPVHMSDRIRQLNRISHELEQSHGRPPTPEELAISLEISTKKVSWLLQVAKVPISLESPVGDDEDSELGMFLEDESTPTPLQVTYQNMLR